MYSCLAPSALNGFRKRQDRRTCSLRSGLASPANTKMLDFALYATRTVAPSLRKGHVSSLNHSQIVGRSKSCRSLVTRKYTRYINMYMQGIYICICLFFFHLALGWFWRKYLIDQPSPSTTRRHDKTSMQANSPLTLLAAAG